MRIAILLAILTANAFCATEPGSLIVPQGCTAGPNAIPEPYTNTGYANTIIHQKTNIELVFIPAGDFMMGDEFRKPVHKVTFAKPFYMGKVEVNNAQYKLFDATGYQGEKDTDPAYELYLLHLRGKSIMPTDDDCPVVWVSWHNAMAFCKWSGQLALPTEAQWEYACRAGTTTRYYFGDDSAVNKHTEYAWSLHNSESKTHPGAQLKPNNWGLYDMIGNVWEWTLDDYNLGYKEAPTDGSANITGAPTKPLRGAAWDYGTTVNWLASSGVRYSFAPGNALNDVGFRAVLNIE